MMADALLLVAAFSACVVYLVMVVLARRRERELAVARAHEERLKSLTELSADWFWETDAEHRITWLSGGGPVATLFGDTPTYGRRFWELPRVEVDARALDAHLERLGKQLPFFDLEIARVDERGARAEGRGAGVRGRVPRGDARRRLEVAACQGPRHRARRRWACRPHVRHRRRCRCPKAGRGRARRGRPALPRCRRSVERIRLGSRCRMALHLSLRAGRGADRLPARGTPWPPAVGIPAARRGARRARLVRRPGRT